MQLKDNLMKSKPSHYLMIRPFLGRSLTCNQKSCLSGTAGLGEGSGLDVVAPGLTLRERGPHSPFCCLGLWPWLHLTLGTNPALEPGRQEAGLAQKTPDTFPRGQEMRGQHGLWGPHGPGVPSSPCAEPASGGCDCPARQTGLLGSAVVSLLKGGS